MKKYFSIKAIISPWHILLFLQIQIGSILCDHEQNITLYVDHNHKGNNTALDISKCTNVPDILQGQVTAIDTKNLCAQLFTEKNCSGKSIEILRRSPAHGNLAYWRFNDMMASGGPCRDRCSVEVTGPLPPKDGLTVTIFDRSSYQGAAQKLNVIGCTIIPRKFNYRILSVNITSNPNCFQLYNNVECKSEGKGYDSIELRSGTPLHDNLAFWYMPIIKAISHCSYKCNETHPQKPNASTSSNTTASATDDLPKHENEVVIFDEVNFKGNQLGVNISDTNCINLDQFNGWEGATQSVQLDKNQSCVMLYATLNCTGDYKMKLNSSLDNMSSSNFSAMTRSLQACLINDGEAVPIFKASKVTSRWGISVMIVVGIVVAAFLTFYILKRKYPERWIPTIFRGDEMRSGLYGAF